MNNIDIQWTSDQRQLIADGQKRQVMMEKDIATLKKTVQTGKEAATVWRSSYAEAAKEIDRLGRAAANAFKPVSTPLDRHLARMKELRVLYRMGKIDAEQFQKASNDSLKQKYVDSGARQRLQDLKREAVERRAIEQKEVDAKLAGDKKAADAKKREEAAERARMSEFFVKRRRSWEESADAERNARRTAADQVRRGLMSEQQLARVNFRERMRQLWDLRRAGALGASEYQAAAKQAQEAWKKVASVDLGAAWRGLPAIIGQTVSATSAVTLGVKVLQSELENLKTKQRNAATSAMTFAEAEEMAIQNLDPTLDAKSLNDMVMAGAKQKQVSPTKLMQAVNSTLASRGEGVSSKEAVQATIEMAEFTRLNPDQWGPVVSAVLAMKGARPDASFKELAGQLQQAKISSKVGSLGAFAERAVPVAVAGRAYGDTEAESFGIYSAIGGATNDVGGRTSASGTVDLQKDLQILSSGVESGAVGGVPVKGGLGKNTIERLRSIAFDPRFKGLQEKLLGENEDPAVEELFRKAGRMTVESRNFGFIRMLYQGDKLAWNALNNKMGEQLEPGAKSSALVDRQLAELGSTPTQKTARTQSALKAEAEILQIDNQSAARGHVSRESLKEILQNAGLSNVDQYMQGLRFEMKSGVGEVMPASAAQQILRNFEREKRSPSAGLGLNQGFNGYMPEALMKSFFNYMLGTSGPRRQPTEDEKAVADSLKRSADALEILVRDEQARRGINVNVQMPGQGEKPGPPAAAGRQRL